MLHLTKSNSSNTSTTAKGFEIETVPWEKNMNVLFSNLGNATKSREILIEML
jgi:hypothetical protein